MKLATIKQEVFELTATNNTKHLKKERPELVHGKDLRYKVHWIEILEKLKALRNQGDDISLHDLEQSEKLLKESLFTVGRLAGLEEETLETDWQRIQLEARFSDLHIEEL